MAGLGGQTALLCSRAVRSKPALVLFALAACWNGADALHKPCTEDDHCGRGQSCIDGACDGPAATSTMATSTQESGTDTGDACNPPVPTTCMATMRVAMRTVVASEVKNDLFGAAPAVVAGDFTGDPAIDVAVLSFDNYNLYLMENAGEMWPLVASYDMPINVPYDLLAVDLDGAGQTEFLVLSNDGTVEVVGWDGTVLTRIGNLDLATPDLVSFATADLIGDAGPELVASASSRAVLVPNVDGALVAGGASSVGGEFAQPWDTLVVGAGASARILVPESNNQSVMGAENQDIVVLRIADDALVEATRLGTHFQNPWALAEGDFLGGDELEIAVAERRLNLSPDDFLNGTTAAGRLRFFRLVGDVVTEVGESLEIGVGPASLAAADLDCDGKTDLVIGNAGAYGMDDGRAQVLFGSCSASADPEDLFDVPATGASGLSAGSRLAVADFDGDGLLEVAIPDASDLGTDGDAAKRLVFVGVEEAP
jgi:FG-GAP repeat